jgi:two-component system sensor kinase FixL
MSWVTVIWSMNASACLTLAVINFFVWWRNRSEWAPLLFAVTAASTTAFAFAELAIMRAQTAADLVNAMNTSQFTISVWLVAIVWFVSFYLEAGRRWLAWTITAMRLACLVMNFLIWPLRENTLALGQIRFLGESVTVLGGGVAQPLLTLFGQFSIALVLVFVADASLTEWRRGGHRKALTVGGSVEFFLLAALGSSSLVFWAHLQLPIFYSLLYMCLIAVMGYELSRDVLRASQLLQELRVSEAGLRESEARISLAVDAGAFGIWMRDLARDEVWASDAWRTLFGFTRSQPLKSADVRRRVHPDDRDALARTQASALAGVNGGRYETEYRLLLPDGTIRWIGSRGRVETDAAGQPVTMRGASRDVTVRKRAEQETQLLRQEIAHAGRVSMMGQLATGLAHEISQPLGAILRNAEAAELFLQHDTPDLDEIRAILADIRADDERASHVIDRMRGLLKRRTLDTRRLDVAALVNEVAALVRVDAASRQVRMDLEVPHDLPQVRGDRVQLEQVLLNLILNGMDALDEARPEDRRVGVTARLNGAQTVEIVVNDAGPGIPADKLGQIFDPFFTTKSHGMGMGLSISRTIIEAHDGQLWAENSKGGGAAFLFTLPIADETTAH